MEERQPSENNEKMPEEGELTPEESGLTPEEILERAKTENEKQGDERERGRMQWGNYVGFIAVELSAVVVMLVLTFIRGVVPTGIMTILLTGLAAQNITQACMCRKNLRPLYITTAVLISAGALMYWVVWILELCGVSL